MNKPFGLLGGLMEIQQEPRLSDGECAAILIETGVDPLLVELFRPSSPAPVGAVRHLSPLQLLSK
jgi:hypothetical protein